MYFIRLPQLLTPFSFNPLRPSLLAADGVAADIILRGQRTVVLWGRSAAGTDRLLSVVGAELKVQGWNIRRVLGPRHLVQAFWQGYHSALPYRYRGERDERLRQAQAAVHLARSGVPLPGGQLLQLRGDRLYFGALDAESVPPPRDASFLARAAWGATLDWLAQYRGPRSVWSFAAEKR